MAQAAVQPEIRSSRFWLYAPFVLLLLVAVAWSAAWFVIRDRTGARLDAVLAAEARAGRQWTCDERRIGGFPFRIEVACANLTLTRGPASASFGRIQSVAQVYQPRHVITEIAGPLRASDGRVTLDATWRLLETSTRLSATALERFSLVAEDPNLKIAGAAPGDLAFASQGLELHLRANPARIQTEGAYDVALVARQARLPALDAWVGGSEPTDLQFDLTATRAESFRGQPALTEIERWRQAGGRIELVRIAAAKGPRRIEAKGELGLDALHRPVGQIQASAAGLDGLINTLTGGQGGGNLLSALLGQSPRPQGTGDAQALSPLPPLRLDDGRILLGPIAIPRLRLPPLY